MVNARLQRIILLIILAYEGWGGITGGTLLTFAPDGHIMKMSTDILHGYFPDFLIPGIILTGMGFLTTAAFFAVLFRAKKILAAFTPLNGRIHYLVLGRDAFSWYSLASGYVGSSGFSRVCVHAAHGSSS